MELSNPEVIDQLLAARSAVTAAEADHAALRMSLESQVLDQRANMAGIEADYESARLQAEAEADLNTKGIISDINFRRSPLSTDCWETLRCGCRTRSTWTEESNVRSGAGRR
jgi:HlyD family secretion protein